MVNNDDYIKIFSYKSEYVTSQGTEIFHEGVQSQESKKRYTLIYNELEAGYLINLIKECKNDMSSPIAGLDNTMCQSITGLVSSMTSEVGRALLGITVLQLVIKCICPEQNIRLHKSGSSCYNFSWKEGISMRTLDKKFITPALREHNLLKLNADGFMMTRSLAENYPYTKLFKAKLRGAKQEWLEIVDLLEVKKICPLPSLKYLLKRLIQCQLDFEISTRWLLSILENIIKDESIDIMDLILEHVMKSGYSARLFEIAMHSLMQVVIECNYLPDLKLQPLTQMRSANKKHGNIGDVELVDGNTIIEAWDAKYGKNYLRDEIEEINDKLMSKDGVKICGFVTSINTLNDDETKSRIEEIKSYHGVELKILTFQEWYEYIVARISDKENFDDREFLQKWLVAYAETLCQKRRTLAPVDEPTIGWINSLIEILENI